MKKFNFSLKAVLQMRESEEKLLKNEIAVVQGRIKTMSGQVDQLQVRLQEERSVCKKNMLEGVRPADMLFFQMCCTELEETIARHLQDVKRLEWEKKNLHDQLVQVRKAIRAYEKLNEEQLNLYQKEVAAAKEKEIEAWFMNSQAEVIN